MAVVCATLHNRPSNRSNDGSNDQNEIKWGGTFSANKIGVLLGQLLHGSVDERHAVSRRLHNEMGDWTGHTKVETKALRALKYLSTNVRIVRGFKSYMLTLLLFILFVLVTYFRAPPHRFAEVTNAIRQRFKNFEFGDVAAANPLGFGDVANVDDFWDFAEAMGRNLEKSINDPGCDKSGPLVPRIPGVNYSWQDEQFTQFKNLANSSDHTHWLEGVKDFNISNWARPSADRKFRISDGIDSLFSMGLVSMYQKRRFPLEACPDDSSEWQPAETCYHPAKFDNHDRTESELFREMGMSNHLHHYVKEFDVYVSLGMPVGAYCYPPGVKFAWLDIYKGNGWIDSGTREVTLSLLAFAPSHNYVFVAELTFFFSLSGAVNSNLIIRGFNANPPWPNGWLSGISTDAQYVRNEVRTLFALQVLWWILLVLQVAGATREVFFAPSTSSSVPELIVLIFLIVCEAVYLEFSSHTTHETYMSIFTPFATDLITIKESANAISSIFRTADLVYRGNVVVTFSVMGLISCILLLVKKLSFYDRVSIVGDTLYYVYGELLVYLLVLTQFMVAVAAVLQSGYGRVGVEVFSDFVRALQTSFLWSQGEFQGLDEMNKLLGSEFIAGFAIFCVLVFLLFILLNNIALSIIVDGFAAVKENQRDPCLSKVFTTFLWRSLVLGARRTSLKARNQSRRQKRHRSFTDSFMGSSADDLGVNADFFSALEAQGVQRAVFNELVARMDAEGFEVTDKRQTGAQDVANSGNTAGSVAAALARLEAKLDDKLSPPRRVATSPSPHGSEVVSRLHSELVRARVSTLPPVPLLHRAYPP